VKNWRGGCIPFLGKKLGNCVLREKVEKIAGGGVHWGDPLN